MAGEFFGVRAGKLRTRVSIEQRNDTLDAAGAIAPPAWTQIAVDWANVQPLSAASKRGGDEAIFAEQLRAEEWFEITMRYRSDITVKHRIVDLSSGKAMNVVRVSDPESRRRRLVILAQAGLVSG